MSRDKCEHGTPTSEDCPECRAILDEGLFGHYERVKKSLRDAYRLLSAVDTPAVNDWRREAARLLGIK